MVTALTIFSGMWSVYLFQAISNTSSLTPVPTILVRVVPVKLWIAFHALPCCSKKRNPCLKIIITRIFLRDDKLSCFHIIVSQINQLLKIFTSTYDFIDFFKRKKDWLKSSVDKLFQTDHLHLSKFAASFFTLLQQYKIVSSYPKLVPVSSVVCKSFILSQRVCGIDPPCYVTTDASTIKNGLIDGWLIDGWLPTHYASTTVDPNPIDVLKSYDETEGSTLFLLPMLKKNVVVFISFLFMTSVFNVRMIFTFCPILTFRFSLFILNSILTFFRYCYYFIYTDIAYMIYYNFLMVLTNLLSDAHGKLRSCFYVF